MSDSNGEFGAFLAGFVIGGLVGAATALILAPQSGSETRSQIVSKGHEIRSAGERRLHPSDDLNEGDFDSSNESNNTNGEQSQQARIVLDSGRKPLINNDNGESVPDGEEEAE